MNENKTVRIFSLVIGNVLALLLALLSLETVNRNFLGWFLFAASIAYGVGGVFYLWLYTDKEEKSRSEQGNRSFWWIVPGFVAVFFFPLLDISYLPVIIPRGPAMQISGLTLIIAGLALRLWTRLTLRGLYSGYLRVKVGHILITSGPYRLIRHPGYTGFLLMALGLAVGYSSLVELFAVLFLLFPGLVYRISVEEKLLAVHFGEEFTHYTKHTKRILPLIW